MKLANSGITRDVEIKTEMVLACNIIPSFETKKASPSEMSP